MLSTDLLFFSGAFHFSEEKSVHSSGDGCNMQMRREFSSHMEQLVTLGEAPPLPPKKKHIKAYMEMVGPYSQPSEVELFHQNECLKGGCITNTCHFKYHV